jgi:hypothetical protein
MNKRQLNKWRMFGAVVTVLDENSALVSSLNDLVTAKERFKSGMSIINQNRQVQEAKTTGLTLNKKTKREILIQMIIKFSAALKGYAVSVNNADIKARADYSHSDLLRVADSVIYDIGELLLGMAVAHKDEMARYFIGDAELKGMEQLLTEFALAIPKKRVATSLSKTSTDNIEGTFTAQEKLLKDQIDVLMLLFKDSNPDFYSAYKNARATVNYTGRGKGAVAETSAVAN